jgi:hypothetical protein
MASTPPPDTSTGLHQLRFDREWAPLPAATTDVCADGAAPRDATIQECEGSAARSMCRSASSPGTGQVTHAVTEVAHSALARRGRVLSTPPIATKENDS